MNYDCWRDPQGNASNPEAHPFRATVIYADDRPGMHGWSSRSQVFATLDEALLVAALLFPAGVKEVSVDVAKNRSTWTENGCWEAICRRRKNKNVLWSKGWSEMRVAEVREYFTKKGI